MGPTILQGVIQHPVQHKLQSMTVEATPKNVIQLRGAQQSSATLQNQYQDRGNVTSNPQQNGRDRLPRNEGYLDPGNHVINSTPGCKSFALNEVARPVFVNHYYAGESMVMNRKLIRLEECDVSLENLISNQQTQGGNCEFVEHSRNSLKLQARGESSRSIRPTENFQQQDRGLHGKSVEHSQNSLRLPATKEKVNDYVSTDNWQAKGECHREFIEPS